MLGIFAILLICIYIVFVFPIIRKKSDTEENQSSVQVKKLWGIAQTSMRERKPLRAEKALLAILKLDEKNAAAYNRLGILYAKGQKYDEAIECFEIAQSLDDNASSLHNAGLIYLETGEYEKAAMAFQQAIDLEGDVPARYIALSKAQEKIGNRKAALDALESAYSLDPSVSTLKLILAIHEAAEDTEAIAATTARIEEQIAVDAKKRKHIASRRIIRRNRPVNMRMTTSKRIQTPLRRPVPQPTIKKPVRKVNINHKIQ
ncbi:tetratricopeptide repeat protein [Candidatus Saccharibacteria bacterium]|nr:tetratricopeptide repeat protein [Candidatus Saccharibacteria bacterium]